MAALPVFEFDAAVGGGDVNERSAGAKAERMITGNEIAGQSERKVGTQSAVESFGLKVRRIIVRDRDADASVARR